MLYKVTNLHIKTVDNNCTFNEYVLSYVPLHVYLSTLYQKYVIKRIVRKYTPKIMVLLCYQLHYKLTLICIILTQE